MPRRSRTEQLRQLADKPGAGVTVLRAFLGVTFTFAALQKLANPNFFRNSASGSFHQQLLGSITTSPLHHLLDVALHGSAVFALLIAIGELAIGLGTLAGLYARVAAGAGMLLSLLFFLTVSFNDTPYYYGSDIVFFFAWTAILIGGAGPWSADALLAARALTTREPNPSTIDRRAFLTRAGAAGALGVAAIALGGLTALIGRLRTDSTANATDTTATNQTVSTATNNTGLPANASADSTVSTKGKFVENASSVPVGQAVSFNDPVAGLPGLISQPRAGKFAAFSAVCPHAGCTVAFDAQNDIFACPCHGSEFDATTGDVIRGPATSGLTPINITVSDDKIYVEG